MAIHCLTGKKGVDEPGGIIASRIVAPGRPGTASRIFFEYAQQNEHEENDKENG